ncbi:MAG: HlyD family secretion protein [Desulfovibrio sp.]|uniref:HlyD family secretion protein n=1 Tax=Desulfovibrio sp. 7SRBS1 TaxID=3378064 RepID=UPI003B3D4AB0
MKKIAIILLLVLLAGGALWYFELRSQTNTNPDELLLSGNMEVTGVLASFRIPGRLTKRLVDEGDSVTQGQLIALLDPTDQELAEAKAQANLNRAQAALDEFEHGSRNQEIKEARAALSQARADVQKAASELEQARADNDRYRDLFARKVVSKQEAELYSTRFKTAQSAYDLAQAGVQSARQALSLKKEGFRVEQIEQARAEVAANREALREAERRLEYTSLTSPVTGTVLTKAAEPGEYLNAGSPVVELADLSHIWLRGFVPENQLGKLHLGQKATITTDAYPDRVFQGRVTFIASEAEFTPKQVQTFEERVKLVYRIKITTENPHLLLKPGMPADARIRFDLYDTSNNGTAPKNNGN